MSRKRRKVNRPFGAEFLCPKCCCSTYSVEYKRECWRDEDELYYMEYLERTCIKCGYEDMTATADQDEGAK